MKSLYLLLTLLILSSCSSQQERAAGSFDIKSKDIPIVDYQLFIAEQKDFDRYLTSDVTVKEIEFEPIFMSCAGVLIPEEKISELLENSDIIYTFHGVMEEWTPINGDPKRYSVFTVKFK